MDPNQNRDNPVTPSSLGLMDQVIYKLAALDASVNSGFRRMDDRMDRFQADLHDNQIATNDRISALDKEMHEALAFKRARIDAEIEKGRAMKKELDDRIQKIETWQQIVMARVGIIVAIVVGLWTFIAPTIRAALGISNG